MEKNSINNKKELKINNKKYIDDIIEIKRKYEEEIKIRKIKYEKENIKIKNKYKLLDNKEIINNNNKIKKLDNSYNNKINNLLLKYGIKKLIIYLTLKN